MVTKLEENKDYIEYIRKKMKNVFSEWEEENTVYEEQPNNNFSISFKNDLYRVQFIKDSFLDNYYYTAETIENVGVFRRFGGSANQAKLFGGFSSTEAVLGRNELAILKKWSTMQFEAELIVEKGAKLSLGKIAPQSVYSGGADQVLLPLGYPENWVKSIKDLKTGTVYSLEEFKIAFPYQIK